GSKAVAGHSPVAINELGILGLTSTIDTAPLALRREHAAERFAVAAAMGYAPAAKNLVMLFLFGGVHRSDADLAQALNVCDRLVLEQQDPLAAYLLGVAFETGGAKPVHPSNAAALYGRCP